MASWKGRNFIFTLNQPEQWEKLRDYCTGKPQFQYGIATLEKAPTTGHKHIHFYCQFNKVVDIAKSKIPEVRVDKCRGSAQQNIDYIRKTNQPEKAGDIIFEQGTAKHKGGPTIAELKQMPKEDREQLPGCYYNIVNKINQEEAKQLDPDDYFKNIEVYYLYGESGSGKTRKAIEMIKQLGKPFNEVKYDGNFWHGASENCEVALYDDWRDSHMKPSEFINFIDYNKHVMNIKGGSIRNQYKHIFITTVQAPEEIYKNVGDEPRRQWERRIKEFIHFEFTQH